MTVKLRAFAIYKLPARPGGAVRIVAGARAATMRPDGSAQIELDSVPLAGGLQAPAHGSGLLMLYGTDLMLEMRQREAQAQGLGARLSFVDYHFQMQPHVGHLTRLAELARGGFVNVRQLSAPLQIRVQERFARWAEQGGARLDRAAARLVQIGQRPDLWPRLFAEDEDFARLGGIVVPVADYADYPGGFRQLVYVRCGVPYRQHLCYAEGDSLALPAWFADSAQQPGASRNALARQPRHAAAAKRS